MQQFFSSKLGQFMIGSGWVALLYFFWDGKISTAMISALLAALGAGGGVHFIYNRSNGKNGGNGTNGGSSDVQAH